MDYELEQRLDAIVRGESDEPAFIEELCAVCAASPDFAWDVLALTDQYHRRGKISANLSRTIRYAVERPALARQAPELAEPMRLTPVAPVCRRTPSAPTADVALQDEMCALRNELDSTRRTLLRYRTRLAKLAAYGHRQRDALAELRRELESTENPAPAPFAPGLYAALALTPWNSVAASAAAAEPPRAPTRWIRPSQVAASIALLFSVTASPALREAPMAPAVVPAAAPAVSPAAAAPTPGRQHLSLDREKTIIAPHDRQALLRVLRTGGSSGDVRFTWWTRPSGAKSGIDYRGRLPTVERLPDGMDALTLSVPIIANPRRLHTELFYVEIGHPAGGAGIGAIGSSAVIMLPMH